MIKHAVLLLASAALLAAQDLAPESIASHAANFTFSPAGSAPATVLAGLFTATQSFRFNNVGSPLTSPRDYTWTRTGPATGTLVETEGTRTLTTALTFSAPLTASFRTTDSQAPAALTGTVTFAPIPQPGPPLVNLSTRATLAAGQVLTPGFVVGGSLPRRVLVRAIGPTLSRFGVAGVMANPSLSVFRGTTEIATNNDWGGGAALADVFARVAAFALPLDSLDAALVLTLAPGGYTAQVRGTGAGEVVVEVYFVD